ncbi:isoamylase early set domain-containing protein [Thermodesulfobacteriota bacterium]
MTFKLPQAATPDAKSVTIVGDFNNWETLANPLRKIKSGTWFLALVLETGRDYQFRYLIDESRWINDWHADRYANCPYAGSDNSVVTV